MIIMMLIIIDIRIGSKHSDPTNVTTRSSALGGHVIAPMEVFLPAFKKFSGIQICPNLQASP